MDARVAAAVAIIVVMAAGALMAVTGSSNNGSGCDRELYFVVYGQEWCPHCQAELRFLNRTYGPDSFEFRDLDEARYGEEFLRVVANLQSMGLPVQAAFPLTGIWKNCRLVAVVQGEISSVEYLEAILKEVDEGRILVVVGAQGFSIPENEAILKAFEPEAGALG